MRANDTSLQVGVVIQDVFCRLTTLGDLPDVTYGKTATGEDWLARQDVRILHELVLPLDESLGTSGQVPHDLADLDDHHLADRHRIRRR